MEESQKSKQRSLEALKKELSHTIKMYTNMIGRIDSIATTKSELSRESPSKKRHKTLKR